MRELSAARGFSNKGNSLRFQGSMRAALALTLCVLMVDQPLLAAASQAKRGPTAGGQQMKGESRVLHALNRLTFGPRPGDVAAVSSMGLTTWFETQLNPSKIDDSALEARLAQFPAMQLPQSQLMARYPSQQVIRQMEQRNASLPSDAVERAIYADQMAFYKVQRENKAARDAEAVTNGTANSMAGDSMTAGAAQAPVMRRNRKAAQDSTGAGGTPTMDGGTTAGSAPDYQAMAAGEGNATAVLPKSDLAEAGQAPDQHVEKLFKDLEAVKILNPPPEERMRKSDRDGADGICGVSSEPEWCRIGAVRTGTESTAAGDVCGDAELDTHGGGRGDAGAPDAEYL